MAVAAARRVEPIDPALLAAALSARGAIDLANNAFAPALVFLNQAIALQQQDDPDGLALALTLDRRALAESQLGQHAQATGNYRAALEIRQKKLSPEHPEIPNSLSALGNALNRAGDPQQATELLRTAMLGARSRFGENHVKTAHYTKNYAMNQSMLRQYDVAAELTNLSVRIEQTLYPEGSPDIVNGLNNLGSLKLVLGRLNAARETLERAAQLNRDGGQADSISQTFVLGNLARVHEVLGNREQALDALRDAERIATKVVGLDHARTVTLKLQHTRLEFLADPTTAAVLLRLTEQILKNPEKLAQFRQRSESEARMSSGLAYAALNQQAQAGESLKRAVSELPSDRIDPMMLPAVIALAEWQRAHGEQAAAEALLRKMIERTGLEFSATHYALGLLHLSLAEALADSRPDEARAHAKMAQAGFAELPEKNLWRARAEALLRRLAAEAKTAAPAVQRSAEEARRTPLLSASTTSTTGADVICGVCRSRAPGSRVEQQPAHLLEPIDQ
jgi:tetratricopeptide (TPR) repeat protein